MSQLWIHHSTDVKSEELCRGGAPCYVQTDNQSAYDVQLYRDHGSGWRVSLELGRGEGEGEGEGLYNASTTTTVPPTGWTYYRPPSLGAPGGWLPEHSITVTPGRLDTPEFIDINIQGEAP